MCFFCPPGDNPSSSHNICTTPTCCCCTAHTCHTCKHVDQLSHISRYASCHRLPGLITFGLHGRSCHIASLVPGTGEVLPSLKNPVLVENTAHTRNTTETLLQRPDVLAQTRPVKLHQGFWLTSMLTLAATNRTIFRENCLLTKIEHSCTEVFSHHDTGTFIKWSLLLLLPATDSGSGFRLIRETGSPKQR